MKWIKKHLLFLKLVNQKDLKQKKNEIHEKQSTACGTFRWKWPKMIENKWKNKKIPTVCCNIGGKRSKVKKINLIKKNTHYSSNQWTKMI
jgi:hypothetical protein